LIEPGNDNLSIERQCALLQVNRSWWYTWKSQDHDVVDADDVRVMHVIDEIYNRAPFYGVRKVTWELHTRGEIVNHKRVARLMRIMGIQSIVPCPKTSQPHLQHPTYPYLLNGMVADHPNHIWGVDITYIRCGTTWLYLYAVLDWYSRFVIAWELSDSLCVEFCVDALSRALTQALPDLHNSDQGSHFTSNAYLDLLLAHPKVQISMDGRGRCMDNIFTEWLWRTVKCEEVYLKDYQSPKEARSSLTRYLDFYNHDRIHQSLKYHTPAAVYYKN